MGSSQEKHRHEEAIKQIDNKRELERYIEENNLKKLLPKLSVKNKWIFSSMKKPWKNFL